MRMHSTGLVSLFALALTLTSPLHADSSAAGISCQEAGLCDPASGWIPPGAAGGGALGFEGACNGVGVPCDDAPPATEPWPEPDCLPGAASCWVEPPCPPGANCWQEPPCGPDSACTDEQELKRLRARRRRVKRRIAALQRQLRRINRKIRELRDDPDRAVQEPVFPDGLPGLDNPGL